MRNFISYRPAAGRICAADCFNDVSFTFVLQLYFIESTV